MTNIAAYRFVRLENLRDLRKRLLDQCKEWNLKGTILLSPEGINLFVAGEKTAIEKLLVELQSIRGMEDLAPKFSESDDQPFSRMLVRIKKEIIAFGVEGIDPGTRTSPKLPARELKRWLDEGRAVTLLDTRNDYEVKLGTFRGAKVLNIDHFRDFPAAVEKLSPDLKPTPIVMFCTGGIRCEKAGPYMEREGFQQIFQLDGGILKYFEEVGADHYDGECFVFDKRVGVDPGLQETDSAICFVCQTPLDANDQKDTRFVVNVSCPFCYKESGEEMAARIEERHRVIYDCTHPLPGSLPRMDERPLIIPPEYDGQTLLATLAGIFFEMDENEWSSILIAGQVLSPDRTLVSAEQIVRSGERYLRLTPSMIEPTINPDIRILHEDEAIIIVEKPAPLPLSPGGIYRRNSLQFILNQAYAPQKIQATTDLDSNATGLVICARTRHFAKLVQSQIAGGWVENTYLIRVRGHLTQEQMGGGPAVATKFKVIQRFPDQTTLLEARLSVGAHQISLHLRELGFDICKAAYSSADASQICFHSWQVKLAHPLTQKWIEFETAKPIWAV